MHKRTSDILRLLRPLVKDAALDDIEFLGYLGLSFWCPTNTSEVLSERALALGDDFRGRLFHEVQHYYKKYRGVQDYAARLGKIMFLLSAFQECSMTAFAELELYRLLNLITEDTFVYKFNFRDQSSD